MSFFADWLCRSRPALNTFEDLGRGITCISNPKGFKRCMGEKEAILKVTRRGGQGKTVFLIVGPNIRFPKIEVDLINPK